MPLLRTRSLGISLDGETASWVELAQWLGRPRVLRAGTLELAAGGGLPPPARRRRITLGLPRRSVVLRPLELPALDEARLAGLLAYDIESHVPFPSDEVTYGFEPLTREGSTANVLLAAARKADVANAMDRLEALGLRPTAVEASSLGAVNARLPTGPHDPDDVLVLIRVSGGGGEVTALSGRRIAYSRALTLDADVVASLASETRRALGAVGRPPTTVCLSGVSEATRAGLERALGLAVEAWRPGGAAVDPAAYGLALGGLVKVPMRIDLLPAERRPRRREPAVGVMLGLLGLVTALAATLGLSAVWREGRDLRRLDTELLEVKARAAEVDTLKAEVAKLDGRLRVLEGVALEQPAPLVALAELVRVLPAGVLLQEFLLDATKIHVRGSTSASASELIAAFERSAVFENAAFTSPISAQGTDRQGFQLQVSIRKKGS